MRLATSLLLLIASPVTAQPEPPDKAAIIGPLSYMQCLVELDSAVALASNETRRNLAAVTAAGSVAATIDRTTVDARLAELETLCPPLPQLAHNRGVLAAKSERWPEAIAHFERSLSQDPRAADTHELLRKIYEYQSSVAYAKALNTPVNVELPELRWQDSTQLNADAEARTQQSDLPTDEDTQSLRTVSTLEYELFAWWQALQAGDAAKQFYIDEYPTASIERSRRANASEQWEDMRRQISFTASDAVVVIGNQAKRRTLLLLRLIGTRWKIYQETPL